MQSPALPDRFLAPAGWETGFFVPPETKHTIHYGKVSPAAPKAVVVVLQGLSEFTEKYFEFMHDMLARGYAVWAMDWAYQGHSARLSSFPQHRHTDGFDKDLSDFEFFMQNHVIPQSGNLPLIMVGHSLGGHLGLRHLAEHPGTFRASAFSAPFLGIHDFSAGLKLIAACISPFRTWIGTSYVFGGCDWHEAMRRSDGSDKFSSDPIRDAVHNAWCVSDPALKVGSVTFSWIIEALKSCALISRPGYLENITIPLFAAVAGNEQIVDNSAIRTEINRIVGARLIELPGACHEVLMERDEYRNRFLSAFDDMIARHGIVS